MVVAHYCKTTNDLGLKVVPSGTDDWNAATPRMVRELVDVLDKGGRHRNDGRESLRGFEAITGMYQSALEGGLASLPLDRHIVPLEELLARSDAGENEPAARQEEVQ